MRRGRGSFWGGTARPSVENVPPAGRFQPTAPGGSFVFGSGARRSRVSCNAVRSGFFRGDKKQGRGLQRAPAPAPAPALPTSRHDAVGERQQAEGELGAAAARRLGAGSGLRWQSVLHRPQHPANFVD